MPTRSTRTASKKKGLSVKTFQGLDQKRMEKKSAGNFGLRLQIKQGDTVPVQFLTKPDEFVEFNQHSWKDGDRWYYVPCAGDECPLCQDEDRQRAKQSYRFAALVYNLAEKKVQILEGPKDLAGRVFYRFNRPGAAAKFLKRTWDITKFPTTPVSYDVAVGEDDLVSATVLKSKSKGVNIDEYLEGELKTFYGADLPENSSLADKTSDDDEDEDEDEEDEDTVEYSLSELKKMTLKKLREIAEDLEIDTEDMDKSDLVEAIVAESEDEESDEDEEEDASDEDEEDEESDEDEDEEEEDDEDEDDEDEDEDEEDEDEEPPAKKRTPAKKAAAKKKAPARRR